ncbi:MAG: hypothetical protein L0216_03915 [Planctomycetales bacterium]|nr:hypothetical protein [Planctomycetales bacterium]
MALGLLAIAPGCVAAVVAGVQVGAQAVGLGIEALIRGAAPDIGGGASWEEVIGPLLELHVVTSRRLSAARLQRDDERVEELEEELARVETGLSAHGREDSIRWLREAHADGCRWLEAARQAGDSESAAELARSCADIGASLERLETRPVSPR